MKHNTLDDMYELHILALTTKALIKILASYPDMLPEELLLIAVAGLLQEEGYEPMGFSRQEHLEMSMDFLKYTYGNESIMLDLEGWRSLEKFSAAIRNLVER